MSIDLTSESCSVLSLVLVLLFLLLFLDVVVAESAVFVVPVPDASDSVSLG
jgi:hypothetical protein